MIPRRDGSSGRSVVLITLAFLLAIRAEGRVEVYMAYTDFETPGVLKTLIQQKNKIPILAVGVNTVSKNTVFGQSATTMAVEPPVLDDLMGAPNTLESKLRKSLQENLKMQSSQNGPISKLQNLESRSLSNANEEFRVANFSGAASGPKDLAAKDLIIVLQSPEYGRQPQLMRRYLETVFQTLKELPQASAKQGGLHLAAFGTAGTVSPKHLPGELLNVSSSLFVGVEMVPNSTPTSYRGRIAFAAADKNAGAPIELYESKSYNSTDQALADVKKRFIDLATGRDKTPVCDLPPSGPGAEQLLAIRSTFKDLLTGYIGETGSLTTSFFADGEVKHAAEKIGITNVNMEDFHLLQSLRFQNPPGAIFDSVDIRRALTDPAKISPAAKTQLKDWLTHHTYSEQELKDAILWGVNGADFDKAPLGAKWTAFDKLPESDQADLIAKHPFKSGRAPVDPFYVSVADQLLKRSTSASYLEKFISKKVLDENPQIRNALKLKADRIQAISKKLEDKSLSVADKSNLVGQVVGELKKVELIGGSKEISVPLLMAESSGAGADQYKIPNLTHDIFDSTGITAQDVSGSINYDKLDRTFYKASLIGLTERVTRDSTNQRSKEIRSK